MRVITLDLNHIICKTMKKEYIKPMNEIVKIEVSHMLAGSFTGLAPDSDDFEFEAPMQRRGEWKNIWEQEW